MNDLMQIGGQAGTTSIESAAGGPERKPADTARSAKKETSPGERPLSESEKVSTDTGNQLLNPGKVV